METQRNETCYPIFQNRSMAESEVRPTSPDCLNRMTRVYFPYNIMKLQYAILRKTSDEEQFIVLNSFCFLWQ